MIRFQKLKPTACLPERGSDESAGLDLCAAEQGIVPEGERCPVSTGLAVALPRAKVGLVWPRSGLAVREGIDVLAGVIDADYRGEIKVVLQNHGEAPFFFDVGQKIAQLVIQPIYVDTVGWAEELPSTVRGEGGFGSTGR